MYKVYNILQSLYWSSCLPTKCSQQGPRRAALWIGAFSHLTSPAPLLCPPAHLGIHGIASFQLITRISLPLKTWKL